MPALIQRPKIFLRAALVLIIAGCVAFSATAQVTTEPPPANSNAPSSGALPQISPMPATPVVAPGGSASGPVNAPASGSAVSAGTDIHDIHDPILLTFWEKYGFWVVLASFTGVVLLALLLWWLLHKKVVAPLTPIERARQEIALARSVFAHKAFAIAVSDAVRRYLENAYKMPAPERTTEEFLIEATRHAWLQGQLTILLRRFLEFCDLAKFAGQEFGEAERTQLLAAASEFVEAAEKLRNPPPAKSGKNSPPVDDDEEEPSLAAT
jgi:hypothetical protein